MIGPHDISVVIQGPVVGKPTDPPQAQLTRMAVTSVRRVLPGAQVIVSTWKGSDLDGLDADAHLLNDDPGGFPCHATDQKYLNNVNRQIVSTRNGIVAAERPYVMKLRSDAALEHTGFLSFVGRYPTGGPGTVVSERLISCTDFSRRATSRFLPMAYHPSDLWYFGRRQDMLNLWDSPPPPEPEFSRWFEYHPRPRLSRAQYPYLDYLHRFTPEQYVWLSFLRKHGEYPGNDWTDLRPEVVRSSEQSLAANLVLVSPEALGVRFCKFMFNPDLWADALMSYGDWLELYRRYCLGSHRPVIDRTRLVKLVYGAGIRAFRPLYKEAMATQKGRLLRYYINRVWDRCATLERRVFGLFTGLRTGVQA